MACVIDLALIMNNKLIQQRMKEYIRAMQKANKANEHGDYINDGMDFEGGASPQQRAAVTKAYRSLTRALREYGINDSGIIKVDTLCQERTKINSL